MFSRRYSSNTGRGRPRFAGTESQRNSDRYRNQFIQSIHSTRNIYEAIIENIRRENDILFSMLPLADHWSVMTPTAAENGTSTGSRNGNANENENNEVPRSNVSSQSFGTPTGVRRTNIQANPFQSLFMDITNMLVNGAGSPEVNRGLTNDQISAVVQNSLYGDLSSSVRESYTTCPITLDQFEDSMEVGVIRPCGHVFRREAITNWLATRHTCPSCRRNLSEQNGAEGEDGATGTGSQSSVSSTHPTLGLHFINPTVRQTQGPNQQMNLEFDGIIGVPSSVGDEGAQQQHISSVLEQMFSLPDITGRTSQTPSQSLWSGNNTSMGALGEIARNYESESEHEQDDSPE